MYLNIDSKTLNASLYQFKKDQILKNEKIGTLELSVVDFPFNGNFICISDFETILKEFFINLVENSQIHLISSLPEDFISKFEKNNFSKEIEKLKIVIPKDKILIESKILLKIQGPLYLTILLSFSISNHISFSSLVNTYAVRMKCIVPDKILFEFGLRRAQSPFGGLTASKNTYAFDGVSNVLASFESGSDLKGTCAHSYIMSFQSNFTNFVKSDKNEKVLSFYEDLYNTCLELRLKLNYINTDLNELKAFCSFAAIYKEKSILLVDTYQVYESGIINSILVGLALNKYNTCFAGIRLDSGNMVNQSKYAKLKYYEIAKNESIDWFKNLKVGASNDINEKVLKDFVSKNHKIDQFGIGTNLVTCLSCPFMELKILNIKNNNIENSFDTKLISHLEENKYNHYKKVFRDTFDKKKQELK